LDGKLSDPGSYLSRVVSALGVYNGEDPNPFGEPNLYSDREFASVLLKNGSDEGILKAVFDAYPIKCMDQNMHEYDRLDRMISSFASNRYQNLEQLTHIITTIRTLSGDPEPVNPTVERIQKWVQNHVVEEISLATMAQELSISRYYMCHLFKRCTGITILDYRNELRLTMAKQALIESTDKITDIASQCGFGSDSYFSEVFQNSEGISPSAYRKLHKR